MLELDAPRMQELTIEVEVHAPVTLAVERVTHERMVDMAHVHADLMSAPGVEVTFDERVSLISARGLEALEHLEGGDGLTGERIVGHGHLHAVARRPRDAGVDRALIHHDLAVDERDVAAVERARANQVLQGALRVVVLGRKHEAGRVAVEPVHDAGAILALDHAKVLDPAMVDKCVGQGAILMPVGWVAHQAALLGQHKEMVVLITDVERNGLRRDRPRLAHLGKLDGDAVTLANDLLLGQARLAVDGNGAGLDQLRAGRARLR